ncbi:MAG: plasmid pRiA4b ORF-3 family protein [Planctomycetes bacterium]|nr:plasmid pRiA4b ORF-3 family protein [Planctomycetota bacterium]
MADFFRFRVQLVGAKPPIFRQFLIDAGATFLDLHDAIQRACGWEDAHLFLFREPKGKTIAGLPDDGGFGDPDAPPEPDAEMVKLASWFSITKNKRCVYEYDFGDGWQHDVTLETIEHHDEKMKRRLLDGARAFPPEDCGGLGGYENCVEVVNTGIDPEGLGEWLGRWKPENFNLVATKRRFDK